MSKMTEIPASLGKRYDLRVLDQVPNMTFALKDMEGRYLFANKRMLASNKLLSLEDALGRSNRDIFPKECYEVTGIVCDEQDREVLTEQKEKKNFYVKLYPDGDLEVELGAKSPYFNEENQCVGLIGHATTLTQGMLFELGKNLFSSVKKFTTESLFSFNIDETPNKYDLSPRESECLFYLLRGKSAKEIGFHLNISPKTVEAHIQQLKYKLNCCNRSQLIEKSLLAGLLFFVPKSLL